MRPPIIPGIVVMIGLLTNAFKNTPPPGTVTVRGRHEG